MSFAIDREDPRAPDIVDLLEQHLALMRTTTAPEFVFALDVEALCHPAVEFFAARENGALLGVGALKRLDAHHGELKSMHTTAATRGRGIGALMVARLVDRAVEQGLHRLNLETGAGEAFAAARRLYARAGFVRCGPFGDYGDAPSSCFMTLELGPEREATPPERGREASN